MHTALLTVFNGVVKGVYNPGKLYDKITGQPLDPYTRWGIYLESCKNCYKNDLNKK